MSIDSLDFFVNITKGKAPLKVKFFPIINNEILSFIDIDIIEYDKGDFFETDNDVDFVSF